MKYMPEILKILEGALKSNVQTAVNHAQLLAEKLEHDGGQQYAKLIREKLSRAPKQMISSAGALNKLPVDSESRFALADETRPTPDIAKALLGESSERLVDEFISYVNHADELIAAGVGISPSLIIHGPPGCGKTILANHIAARLGLPLLTARCDTVISSFLGATSKNIRSLFDHASGRPCVLFLDEFDALGKARDDKQELGELKRVVVSLLQNIDALSKNTILIAATNHPQLLDPAVWRRFSYRIEITKPDIIQRKNMFSEYLGKYAPLKGVDDLAELSDGLTGSDIEQIVHNSIRTTVLKGDKCVVLADLARRLIVYRQGDSQINIEQEIILLRENAPQIFDYRTLHNISGLSMRKIIQFNKNQKVSGHDSKAKQSNSSDSAK